MRYAVVGGDKRSALLCSLFLADGHRVTSFALDRAELPEGLLKAGCIQSSLYGADCVVLPVPAERAGLLNTPLSDIRLSPTELLQSLWPGQIVFGGGFDEDFCRTAVNKGIGAVDILKNADFVTGNAAVTAECALALLIETTEKAIYGSRALVTGWGRLAKHMSFRLAACGAELTVAARRTTDLAMAQSLGFEAVSLEALEESCPNMDFIINTVPARVFSKAALCCCESGTVIMELASAPGGFDRILAENIGMKVINAPGLPGRFAPYAAAELMRNAIYNTLNGQEELT